MNSEYNPELETFFDKVNARNEVATPPPMDGLAKLIADMCATADRIGATIDRSIENERRDVAEIGQMVAGLVTATNSLRSDMREATRLVQGSLFREGDPVYVRVPKPEGEVWPLIETFIEAVHENAPGCFWYMVKGQDRVIPEDRIQLRLEVSQSLEAA